MSTRLFCAVFMFAMAGCAVTEERKSGPIAKEGTIDIGSYTVRAGGKMESTREYVSTYSLIIKSQEDVSEPQASEVIDSIAADICSGLKFDSSGGAVPDFVNNTSVLGGQYSNSRVQTGSLVLATFGCY